MWNTSSSEHLHKMGNSHLLPVYTYTYVYLRMCVYLYGILLHTDVDTACAFLVKRVGAAVHTERIAVHAT